MAMYARPIRAHYARFLSTLLLLCASSHAQTRPVERAAEGTWVFAAQNVIGPRSSECADSITHDRVWLYFNIVPRAPGATAYATRWRDLSVNGQRCERSEGAATATIFVRGASEPFFLAGEDNSPRRCGKWVQKFPARYYFVDDMPRHRAFFEDSGFVTVADPGIVGAVKGEVFMMSQQFDPVSGEALVARVVCFYRKVDQELVPLQSPDAPVPTPCGDGCL